MTSGSISLAYSVADQSFARTKSIGILNLSLQLGEALASRAEFQRFEVFSNSSLLQWHSQLAGKQVHCFDRACDTRVGRILWDQSRVYTESRKQHVEWLFLPKGFASFCRKPGVKVAAYVHDVIGDWYSRVYPSAVSKSEAWYFRQSLLATLRHSSVIFTNSEFTRKELLAFAERNAIRPPNVSVAGIGFRASHVTPESDRNGVVVLASPLPHKRTDLALQFMTAWDSTNDVACHIHWVGRFPAGLKQPSNLRWKYHERLDEPTYQSFLRTSKAVVYLSEYEGFGMPPIEAVLNGACPVYSDIPATRETMRGSGAAFENASYESFAAAMSKAIRMQGRELEHTARNLMRCYNWPAVADRIIEGLKGDGAST